MTERDVEKKAATETFALQIPLPPESRKEALPLTEKTSLFVPTRYLNTEKVGFRPSSILPGVYVTRNIKELLTAVFKYGDTDKRFGEGGLEEDPSRQQIIIYSMVLCQEHILWYQRASEKGQGDPRLRGKYSIGIGGHKTREDISSSREDLFLKDLLPAIQDEVGTIQGLNHGFFSEVQEEIAVSKEGIKKIELLGCFADRRKEDPSLEVQVGEVHVGIAAYIEVDPLAVSNLIFRKKEIAKAWWMPIGKTEEELRKLQRQCEMGHGPRVETWTEVMVKEFLKDLPHQL